MVEFLGHSLGHLHILSTMLYRDHLLGISMNLHHGLHMALGLALSFVIYLAMETVHQRAIFVCLHHLAHGLQHLLLGTLIFDWVLGPLGPLHGTPFGLVMVS